jgi:hypothetical protein
MHTICGIWADVMRMRLLPEEKGKHDADWWVEHQNEIAFTLRVLMGLGLAFTPNHNRILGQSPKHTETLEVKPSNAMKRLHRYSRAHYRYRDERDKQLTASVAKSTGREPQRSA